MKRGLKVKQLVLLGFGIVFVIMIIIGLFSWRSSEKSQQGMDWVEHTYKVKLDLGDLKKYMVDAETGQRGFLYTGEERYLEPYNIAAKEREKKLTSLRSLVDDNPAQVDRVDGISGLINTKFTELDETIQLKKAGREQEVLELVISDKGKSIMDELRRKFDEFEKIEDDMLVTRIEEVQNSIGFSQLISVGGTLLAVLFGCVISIFISVSIVSHIEKATTEISSSVDEVITIAENQERSAAQQSAAVNQISSTMTELEMSSKQSTEQAESAAQDAKQALEFAEEGTKQMKQAETATTNLKGKVDGIAEQILHLSEQTNQIQGITNLVSDLANQTNLLALNAAVEAARAGDYGRGFAVVAVEIRKLADESKKSADEINALVNSIQKATNSTVMVTEEGTKMVEEVAEIARKSADLLANTTTSANSNFGSVQQVLLNIRQQAEASKQNVLAINSIKVGANETVNGATNTKLGVQQIKEASKNIRAIV